MYQQHAQTCRTPQLSAPGNGGKEGGGSGAEDTVAGKADDRDRHDPFAEELDEQVCDLQFVIETASLSISSLTSQWLRDCCSRYSQHNSILTVSRLRVILVACNTASQIMSLTPPQEEELRRRAVQEVAYNLKERVRQELAFPAVVHFYSWLLQGAQAVTHCCIAILPLMTCMKETVDKIQHQI